MRKEVGKPVRDEFFRGVASRFPCFKRVKGQRVPGFTWDWVWRISSRLTVWLTFQRHKNEDAFTLQFAWAQEGDEPPTFPFVTPEESATVERGCFRVGELWDPRGDYWWTVVPGPDPDRLVSDPVAYVEELMRPQPLPADLAVRVQAAVQDALVKLEAHLLPHIIHMAATRGDPEVRCL